MINKLQVNIILRKSPKVFVWSFLFLFSISRLMAQRDITGEYDLEGVMETGSGIIFNADHTFQIFFSYGSVDKDGNGTWTQSGNEIVLTSDPRPAHDFRMITHRHVAGDSVTIKIMDSNRDILPFVDCLVKNDTGKTGGKTNQDGIATFASNRVDSIGLFHELFSDRASFFKISDSTENYFEFAIEPWIMKIFCDHLVLTMQGDYLIGRHPLLDGDSYKYVKAQ